MRDFAAPAAFTVGPDDSLTDFVFDVAARRPDTVSFARNDGSGFVDLTARQFADAVTALAKGLIASGIGPGDRVGLLSKTRYEWTLADFAILTAGAVTVPIYETSAADQIAWNLGDSGAVAVVLETAEHAATLDGVSADLPEVKNVWRIDTGDLDRLAEAGRGVADDEIARRREGITADSLASIIYTSGTTGRPKGCELTHGNFLSDAHAATQVLPVVLAPGTSTLLFLPLAHAFARIIQIVCVQNGVRLGFTAEVKNLVPDLEAFRPTFVLAVPRVFEKIYNAAGAKAHGEGRLHGAIFDRAAATAIRYSEALDRGRPGRLLAAQRGLYERLVYRKIRDRLGGRVDYAISGGAPLGARLGHFFRGIGVEILEGYGLTETAPAIALNPPGAVRMGSVGQPLPGVAVRISDDGEILTRGGIVFRGYWHDPAATAALFADGWLRTGDLGELDADGYLSITGRKKEILVTANGKNVAPAALEDAIAAHPLIGSPIVVGDRQPFIAALVTLDPDGFATWKRDHGRPSQATVADLRDDPGLRAEVQSAVDAANRAVSRAESVRAWRILDAEFTEESGHLTPTMKLKRDVVLRDFAADVDAIYAG